MLSKLTKIFTTTAAINSIAGMVAGAFRPLIAIFTLPLLAGAIGSELMGFWLGALALSAVFSCVNTGVSAAVVTAIGNFEPPEEVVRNGFVLAGCCSIVAIALGLASYLVLDWHSIFQLSNEVDSATIALVMTIVFVSLAIGFPAQLGRFVAIGRRQGYKAQMIDMLALMAGPLALLAAIAGGYKIVGFAMAFILLPVIVTLVLGTAYLAKERLLAAPGYKILAKKLREMASQATPMAAHQGLLALNQHGDVLIVGVLLGPVEAAFYGIAQRLCTLANFVITPINHAFWPELTSLIAQSDTRQVRQYFAIQLILTMGFALAFAVGMSFFGNYAISIWMGPEYQASFGLLAGLSAGVLAFSLMTTMETILRAQKRFAFLFKCTLIGVPVAIGGRILVAEQLGVAGVAWIGAILMVLFVGIPYAIAAVRSSTFAADRTDKMPDEVNKASR